MAEIKKQEPVSEKVSIFEKILGFPDILGVMMQYLDVSVVSLLALLLFGGDIDEKK